MGVNIITAADGLAKEGGSFPVEVSFTDEDGNALVPDTLYWNLVDEDDSTINSREAEEETPAASVTIILQGDDLVAADKADDSFTHIWLVVYGTYSSDIGSDLPFYDQVRISVEAIKGEV